MLMARKHEATVSVVCFSEVLTDLLVGKELDVNWHSSDLFSSPK